MLLLGVERLLKDYVVVSADGLMVYKTVMSRTNVKTLDWI